jgi:alpha-1,6-mannosyltransferase
MGERGLGFYQQPGIRCWPLRWPSGHIDILGALLLVVSVAALARHWRSIAAVTFGLTVAVKFQPIVLVPLYWKRVRIRDAAVAAAVVGLLYVSFLNRGLVPTGSLGTYVWPLQPG